MPPKKPTLQYAILTVLAVWALVAELTACSFVLYLQNTRTDELKPPFLLYTYSRTVQRVLPGYEHSGIQANDDVIEVNGKPLKGVKVLDDVYRELHPGDTLRLTLRRTLPNGQVEIKPVSVRLLHETALSFRWTIPITLEIVLPLSCLLLGFFVAFMRPQDPVAWITMAMLASFGQVGNIDFFWSLPSPWREILLVFRGLNHTYPLWMLLFGLYFPFPFQFVQRRKWIVWLLAVPFICITALDLIGDIGEGEHLAGLQWLAHFVRHDTTFLNIVFACYIAGFFTALITKGYQIGGGDASRRLQYMAIGCSLALVPLLVLVISQLTGWGPLPLWAITICLLMLLFFPATMAYVIVVQRAMDIRMVVRSGVQYAFASTGIQILRIALITGLVIAVSYLIQHSARGWETALIIGVGITLAVLLGKAAVGLKEWIDRRFFREAYNAEVILTELSNSVAGFRDTKKLLETVTHRISQSLHVPEVAVLLESGDSYEPAYLVGLNGDVRGDTLARDALTVRLLKQSQAPSRVYFDDPQSWVHGASEQEQSLLHKLDTQLLLPMAMNSRLLGMISLGPKRSELPYSGTDIRLLNAVASQTGLALDNARLTESIKREVAQRERINRELEIAREVQERLFPQRLPQVQGLEVAGYCRPALGVGGDYYDFLRLPDGCVGMAIGDVAGKGIGAALMMAGLQASLRGQAIRPCTSLSEMIQLINRLVYEASASNTYATFFYGQYDPQKKFLHYVNAGHNAPILYRSQARPSVIRLDRGGTVIGLLPEIAYEEDCISLQPGDVLIAYTDGISEAMTRLDEEWGEERLMQAIGECYRSSATEIIQYILKRVDAFTAGARQHDDMTLAVMRVQ